MVTWYRDPISHRLVKKTLESVCHNLSNSSSHTMAENESVHDENEN